MMADVSVPTTAQAPPGEGGLRVAVGIATRGRPAILAETIAELRLQTRPPDGILICYAGAEDIAGVASGEGIAVKFLTAPAGLTIQRNAILDVASAFDVLIFLDDDFLAAPHYVEATLAAFAQDTEIVVTTGTVIADGAKGSGLSCAMARATLRGDGHDGGWPGISPAVNGYGCNMALRLAVVRRVAARFDERLPLYGWYEDIDFTRRLGRHGKIARLAAARGVHLGTKAGRTSGVRLGYSQIVNPVYLARKGSYPWSHALSSMSRHLLMNLTRSLAPESWVDRRGRLAGNARGLRDLLLGRAAPERILKF